MNPVIYSDRLFCSNNFKHNLQHLVVTTCRLRYICNFVRVLKVNRTKNHSKQFTEITFKKKIKIFTSTRIIFAIFTKRTTVTPQLMDDETSNHRR